MSKTRMINTRFWSDGFVVELNPLDRYFFLYFLTNEHTNISGIYELPLSRMATETGLDKEMLPKMLKRLKDKVFYIDGWVYIKNFQKHQSSTSSTVRKGIEVEMAKIPPEITEKIKKIEGMDRVSDHIIYSNLNSNLNLNLNSAPETVAKGKKSKYNVLGAEIIRAFEAIDAKNRLYYGNKTQRGACDYLLEEYGLAKVLEVVEALSVTNKLPYFPSINSPNDLKEKWGKLQDAFEKQKTKHITNGRGLA